MARVPGILAKLKIEAFEDADCNTAVSDGTFELTYNPDSYSVDYETCYRTTKNIGASGSSHKLEMMKPKSFSFKFILDGTLLSLSVEDSMNIAKNAEYVSKEKVTNDIAKLVGLMGTFEGETHRPYYCKISWGSLTEHTVMKKMSVNYTMFSASGMPMRAEVNATFEQTMSDSFRKKQEDTQSPDLSHFHVVKEGDTLPGLCQKYYDDFTHYVDVAAFNELANFRQLKAGTPLTFPPLEVFKEVES
ncbi:MAG: LysM peptidoglycan-binding domain-containing protein [Lentisphaeraceae bacterium]|nr:LysM peptidoglycan-binding domain-containing protein [Lentisphaeraceae bacterium]